MGNADLTKMIHDITDLTLDLAVARRIAKETRLRLLDAQHALANGRTHIVEEFLDRAITDLARIN